MNQRLKILHVTRSIDPTGGCEIYIHNLIEKCSERNIRSSVCVAILPTRQENLGRVPIDCVNELASLTHQNAKTAVREFSSICAKVNPDIIHIHDLNNPYVIEYAGTHFPTIKTTLNADAYCGGIDKYLYTSKKACGRPLGYGCFGVALFEKCMKRHPKRSIEIISIKKSALRALKNVYRVIVPSEASKKILIQNRVPADKIEILPLFANIATDTSSENDLKNSKKILFLGRLRPYKGVEYLLRALALTKSSCELEIVGGGEDRPKLEKLAENLQIQDRVHFLGNQPHEKIKNYLASCAFLVVPSIYPDSFPTVGLEAMAMSKPVIGFRIGGIPEWLNDGETGFLVEAQDVNELAKKIDDLLQNPERTERMGKAGRKRFEAEFTGSAHMERLVQIYEAAIASFDRSKTCAP